MKKETKQDIINLSLAYLGCFLLTADMLTGEHVIGFFFRMMGAG